MTLIPTEHRKPLSVFGLTMINVIAIDSLRSLPINAEYGFALVGLYLLGTLFFFLPCLLVTAELATHFPETGGSYVWVKHAFGPKMAFMNSWLLWVFNVVWFPAILTFVGGSIAYLISPTLVNNKTYLLSIVIGLFIIATLCNWFGIKISSAISSFGAILGTLVPMTLIIFLGGIWLLHGKPIAIHFQWNQLFPNIHVLGDLSFFVVILYSLIGLEMSAIHAGDVKQPERDYPRSLWWSAMLVLLTTVLSSLAIAIILPKSSISIVAGLNQAFYQFLHNFGLTRLLPLVMLCIIMGGFACLSAWVLGPTRALMIAAKDGSAPRLFAKTNQHDAPIIVLLCQLGIVILLCSLFSLFKTISAAYWVLSDLTAQLALIYYIILFAAAIKLKKHLPHKPHTFRIPGGSKGTTLVSVLGIFGCGVAILLGFLPPESVHIDNLLHYDLTLIISILLFLAIPWLLNKRNQKEQSRSNTALEISPPLSPKAIIEPTT